VKIDPHPALSLARERIKERVTRREK